MAIPGAEILTKFTADKTDFDKKSKEVEKDLSGLKNAFLGIGAGAAVIGKAYSVVGNELIDMTQVALKSAGELQQQMGGTEAVFGDFASTVQDKAAKSFEVMGTSANDYMATINKMASILQGSGYTVEDSMNTSAEVMQRAADVASVMGITVDEAMNAITAAAKGNFTMMDNLGVAMNATNLEAYALSQGIKKSYSEMTTAEKSGLAYQMFLEKTAKYAGNYAKENDTLAGSMQTLNSAVNNFMSGAGGISEVINSAINVVKTVIPEIIKIVPQLVNGFVEIINAVIPMIPDIVKQLFPAILEGTQQIIIALINALPDLILMIAEMLPTLMPMIVDAIMAIIPALIDNLPLFLEAGAKLLGGLIAGIVNTIPILLARIGEAVVKLIKAFKDINLVEIGKNIISGLWNGIKSMKDWVINKVKDLGKSILKGLKGILGISSPSKEFALIGKFSVLGYTEALDNMSKDVDKQLNETFGINPQVASSSALNYTPNVIVNNNINMRQDPLGQMVNDIKTFSGGSKNDYNYGMGV